MNNIKNFFTIQDLEIYTGIKSHSIRIWEKRYNLLNPIRLNRNIRMYDLSDLQKILNVSFLYNNNYKISKLADFSESELVEEVKTIALNDFSNTYEINSLIISMYTFDSELFQEIYTEQIKKQSFNDIFVSTYIPLINYISVLWQTLGVRPIHEHFISSLILSKIVLNTEVLKKTDASVKHVNALFLPEGEIHELGVQYLNYYLRSKGERTIYLGQSVPPVDLFYLNSQFKEITWISYFTLNRTEEEKEVFMDSIVKLLDHTKNQCIVIGQTWSDFSKRNENKQIVFKNGLSELITFD